MADDRIKILFELKRDENGYPPADVEGLWAAPLGNDLYRIENIPFFVKGISCDDIVKASTDSAGAIRFGSLVKPSAHSTLRVVVFRSSPDSRPLEDRVVDLRNQLAEIGCSSELSHVSGLIAVDTEEVRVDKVRSLLQAGEDGDLWQFEEGAIRD